MLSIFDVNDMQQEQNVFFYNERICYMQHEFNQGRYEIIGF
jgi:hypothetical protein